MTRYDYTKRVTERINAGQANNLFRGNVYARVNDYACWGQQEEPELTVYAPVFQLGLGEYTFAQLCLRMKKLRTLVDPKSGLPVNVLAGFEMPELTLGIFPFQEARVLFGNTQFHGGTGCMFDVCDPQDANVMLIVYHNDEPVTNAAGRMLLEEYEHACREMNGYVSCVGDDYTGFIVMSLAKSLGADDKKEVRNMAADYLWEKYRYDKVQEEKLWREKFALTLEQVQSIVGGKVSSREVDGREIICVENYSVPFRYQNKLTQVELDLTLCLPNGEFWTQTSDDYDIYCLKTKNWSTLKQELKEYFQDPFELREIPQLADFICLGLPMEFLFGEAWRDRAGKTYFMPRAIDESPHMLVAFPIYREDDHPELVWERILRRAALYWQENYFPGSFPYRIMEPRFDVVAILPMGYRVPVLQTEHDRQGCVKCYRELLHQINQTDPERTEYNLVKETAALAPELQPLEEREM